MANGNKKNLPPAIPNMIISVSEQVKNGVYSNIVNMTTTSNKEVIFDFIFSHPNDKGANQQMIGQVVSRVILPLEVARSMKLVIDSQLGKTNKE